MLVCDLKRTRYNGFSPERLADILAAFAVRKRVITIGNAMGGYGAIWATTAFPVDTAIGFAPQYSVHPRSS